VNFKVFSLLYKISLALEISPLLNKIDIYNGLMIPKSKNNLDKIIKYINDGICKRYIDNEELLRKKYNKDDKIEKAMKTYYSEHDQIENNVKIEISKNEMLTNIYNQNENELKKLSLEDYLKYFIIKYLEKNPINYKMNENLLEFLKLIIKIKGGGTCEKDESTSNRRILIN